MFISVKKYWIFFIKKIYSSRWFILFKKIDYSWKLYFWTNLPTCGQEMNTFFLINTFIIFPTYLLKILFSKINVPIVSLTKYYFYFCYHPVSMVLLNHRSAQLCHIFPEKIKKIVLFKLLFLSNIFTQKKNTIIKAWCIFFFDQNLNCVYI